MWRRVSCFAVIVGVFATGCAFGNHQIEREYVPHHDTSEGFTSAAVWQSLEFSSLLEEMPSAVGVKKNGYGWETAFVEIAPSPQAWLDGAAQLEFGAAGIDLAKDDDTLPSVQVKVHQFFVEPDVGVFAADAVAVTVLEVVVRVPQTGEQFKRRFVGESKSTELVWLDTFLEEQLMASAQIALSAAAKETGTLLQQQAKQ